MKVTSTRIRKGFRSAIVAILMIVPIVTYGTRMFPTRRIVLWPADLTYRVIDGVEEPIGRGPVVIEDGKIHWFGTHFIDFDTEIKSPAFEAPELFGIGRGSYFNFHYDSDANQNCYYWRNEYEKRLESVAQFCLVYPVWLLCVWILRRVRVYRDPYACRQCGYDLTGNESGTCSECGAMTHVPRYPSDDDYSAK